MANGKRGMNNVRQKTQCSECGAEIVRVIWNYGKNRPIENSFCNNTCKGAWQVKKRESLGYTEEWLRSEYIDKGKSANQIAREINRDPKRVWEWMRDYGIPIKPRGSDYGNLFVQGGDGAFKGKTHTDENKAYFRELRLQDGRVPYLKDGKHWLHHEGAVSPNFRGGISPDRQAFYATDEWKSAVKAVWKRDNATCQICKVHHNLIREDVKFHIHHIVSFIEKATRAEPSNLVLLCRPCHLWVHSRKNVNKLFLEK